MGFLLSTGCLCVVALVLEEALELVLLELEERARANGLGLALLLG